MCWAGKDHTDRLQILPGGSRKSPSTAGAGLPGPRTDGARGWSGGVRGCRNQGRAAALEGKGQAQLWAWCRDAGQEKLGSELGWRVPYTASGLLVSLVRQTRG